MTDTKLGKLIEGEADRDAIHIAIAPVVAGEELTPGEHVGLLPDGRAGATGGVRVLKPIGIVDPFLTGNVVEGQKFWLCLYQQTVTGMRHYWSHPAFVSDPAKVEEAESPLVASLRWMRDWGAGVGMSAQEALQAGHAYVDHRDYVDVGHLEWLHTPSEYWKHFEILTGKKGEGSFFNCSC